MATIYVSSTYEDLKEHREAAWKALEQAGHRVVAMEQYVASDQRPLDRCLNDVARCDVYVGMFAYRYGFVVPDRSVNPEGLSITELEFRKAKKLSKPCLTFLHDPSGTWSTKLMDSQSGDNQRGGLIEGLKERLRTDSLCSMFIGVGDLTTKLLAALAQLNAATTEPTPPPSEKTGPQAEFARLCNMIEQLHTYKHFHDLAHELYEPHYKNLLLEVKGNQVSPRTIGECMAEIENATAEYKGLLKEKPYFFSARDQEQVARLLACLDECKGRLAEVPPGAEVPTEIVNELKSKLVKFGSSLGLALNYFNERMVRTAKEFEPKRFMDSLQAILTAQQTDKEEWSRLAVSIDDTQGRLLAEHNVLQGIQDTVQKFEPENFDSSNGRESFLDEWPDIADALQPLLAAWRKPENKPALDSRALRRQQHLGQCFSAVESLVGQLAGSALDTERLAALKRDYGDFADSFDKYFLRLDKVLKDSYRRIGDELQERAGELRNQLAA